MMITTRALTGMVRRVAVLTAMVGWVALAGCATGPNANPKDPFEPYNRSMTNFNLAVDDAVLKPVATAYKTVTPSFVQTGVSNFFSNLGDLWTAVNGALQFKGQVAMESFMRFNVNTFLGLGGLLDIASEMQIERRQEDFGQTLGRWGVPSGPYVVLPLLGPSTLRDTLALGVDMQADLLNNVNNNTSYAALAGLRIVDTRSHFLSAGNLLEAAALDKYSFLRDVYLQRRQSQVYDGQEPETPDTPIEK